MLLPLGILLEILLESPPQPITGPHIPKSARKRTEVLRRNAHLPNLNAPPSRIEHGSAGLRELHPAESRNSARSRNPGNLGNLQSGRTSVYVADEGAGNPDREDGARDRPAAENFAQVDEDGLDEALAFPFAEEEEEGVLVLEVGGDGGALAGGEAEEEAEDLGSFDFEVGEFD